MHITEGPKFDDPAPTPMERQHKSRFPTREHQEFNYKFMERENIKLTYEELAEWLGKEDSRVVDARMLDTYDDWNVLLQFLCGDNKVREAKGSALDMHRLNYFNSKRMNPALWGEFDNKTGDSVGQSAQTD